MKLWRCKMRNSPRLEQADGESGKYRKYLKKKKIRLERRKAKENPETQPTYGKYYGYQS